MSNISLWLYPLIGAVIAAFYIKFVGTSGLRNWLVTPVLIMLFFLNVFTIWKYDTDTFHYAILCARDGCPKPAKSNLKNNEPSPATPETIEPTVGGDPVPGGSITARTELPSPPKTTGDPAPAVPGAIKEIVIPKVEEPVFKARTNPQSLALSERFSIDGLAIGLTAQCPECFRKVEYGNERMPTYQMFVFFKENDTGRTAYMTNDGKAEGQIVLVGRSFRGKDFREGDALKIAENNFGKHTHTGGYMDYFWFGERVPSDLARKCTFEPSDMGLGYALILSNGSPSRGLLHPPRLEANCGTFAGISTYGKTPTIVVIDSDFFTREKDYRLKQEKLAKDAARTRTIEAIKF